MLQTLGILIGAGVLLRLLLSITASARRLSNENARHEAELVRIRKEAEEAVRAKRATVDKDAPAWGGYRKFEVTRKVKEADNVCSLYLTPHDRKTPLPRYEPGQHLTFQFTIPGESKPIIRCYSLSDAWRPDLESYRITVKKVPPPRDKPELPPGKSSTLVVEVLKEGDLLDVRAPKGKFTLDLAVPAPAVLIGGGIGLTPVYSMLKAVAEIGDGREVWFFYGVTHGGEHIWKDEMKRLAVSHENLNLRVCYSKPREGTDRKGEDFDHDGRVGVALFKQVLKSNNYRFYICGPPPMMNSVTSDLREWGVPDEHVHFEAFGPASVRQTSRKPAKPGPAAAAKTLQVNFAKSGVAKPWNPEAGSILAFSRECGVTIDSGCESGNCNSCMVAIKSGEVQYVSDPAEQPPARHCLTCVSIPKENLTLDA